MRYTPGTAFGIDVHLCFQCKLPKEASWNKLCFGHAFSADVGISYLWNLLKTKGKYKSEQK